MSSQVYPNSLHTSQVFTAPVLQPKVSPRDAASRNLLPAQITRAASSQTYYTIRFLVDRGRVQNAYRAYAYFRWVDDWLDRPDASSAARVAFVRRQQALIDASYRGETFSKPTPEEQMLVDLLDSEPAQHHGGLHAYIRHMMAVMTFDTERRGRLITQAELDQYSLDLATAVTEALHYFIGHDQYAPRDDTRYLAVIGAHVTHMLRDTFEDIDASYYNVPRELLEAHNLAPSDTDSAPYREWVRSRVELARASFDEGRRYLARVENRRCRAAGYAYMARFSGVLDTIERDGYRLRPVYSERKGLKGGLKLGWSFLSLSLGAALGSYQ